MEEDDNRIIFLKALQHDPDTVVDMIKAGMHINMFHDDDVALEMAIEHQNLRAVELLTDEDAFELTSLRDALIAFNDTEVSYQILKLLLEKGRHHCDRADHIICSSLFIALEVASLKCVKLLLDHGADLKARDSKGKMALHYAVQNPRVEVLQFVLDQDFDVEHRDNDDCTALCSLARNM